jgi:hypothetical protein
MSNLELNQTNEELNVTVSFDRVSKELCEQYILSGTEDERPFAYLASLTLETTDNDDYDINRVFSEYLRNSSSFEHLTVEDVQLVEEILRESQ